MYNQDKNKIIVVVPNQKKIIIKKSIINSDNVCNVKLSSNIIAMQELTPNAYKLYMYFCFYNDNSKIILSFSNICNIINMSEKTYHRSVKELIKYGYLIKINDRNDYIFCENKINGEYNKIEDIKFDFIYSDDFNKRFKK